MNAFQISAGYVPPATGMPVELVRHRDELVGVADPDGDDELRREADEPRVAVVLGRAGLAGDLAVRAAAAAVPVPPWTTPCSSWSIDRRPASSSAPDAAPASFVSCLPVRLDGSTRPRAARCRRSTRRCACRRLRTRCRRVPCRAVSRARRRARSRSSPAAASGCRARSPCRRPRCGPTIAVSCEKTELSETAIAFDEVDRPERLALVVVHLPEPAARVDRDLLRRGQDARTARCSRLSAVASTNGLNAEPGWRSPCVARLNWFLW